LQLIGKARSPDGAILRLTERCWKHIATEHPEVKPYLTRILRTVEEPDLIASGATGELKAIKWFEDLHVGSKHLVVVYRKTNGKEGFIVTAYVTSDLERVSRRGVLWRKS
jgi:hypothetical protein